MKSITRKTGKYLKPISLNNKPGPDIALIVSSKAKALSAAEKVKWDGLLAPMVAEWIAEARSKNLDGEAVVKDMKALIEKHSK